MKNCEVPSSGAVEGSRTPTSKWTLDPEPSASTNSATTAFGSILCYVNGVEDATVMR